MTLDLDNIKALTFDVGGTVFDWHSGIRDELQRLADGRGVEIDVPAATNEWRFGMFQHLGRVRSGELPWMNADELHRLALDDVAERHPQLDLSPSDRDELNTIWHRLPVWPDFPGALEGLRSRYTVVVLTVLSWALVVDSSKAGGLSWDGVLSCEFLGHYKPDREAYEAGAKMLGLAPEQVMMVAAHPGDLRAAMVAGFRSAYVPRPGERGEGNDGDLSPQNDIDINAIAFRDLVRQVVG